eukprot:6183099-Pleurochrysis_carterae.AAC.1
MRPGAAEQDGAAAAVTVGDAASNTVGGTEAVTAENVQTCGGGSSNSKVPGAADRSASDGVSSGQGTILLPRRGAPKPFSLSGILVICPTWERARSAWGLSSACSNQGQYTGSNKKVQLMQTACHKAALYAVAFCCSRHACCSCETFVEPPPFQKKFKLAVAPCTWEHAGHKMGEGAPLVLRRDLLKGDMSALRHDLPELPELDNLFAPEGAIADAQRLAAEAFGAKRSWFLVNGSTCGVIAAVLACVQLWIGARIREAACLARVSEEDCGGGGGGGGASANVDHRLGVGGVGGEPRPRVLLPRNVHRSAVHALVMAGAEPVWVVPEYDEASGLTLGLSASKVAQAIKANEGSLAAVMLVSPTYHGMRASLDTYRAAACKR